MSQDMAEGYDPNCRSDRERRVDELVMLSNRDLAWKVVGLEMQVEELKASCHLAQRFARDLQNFADTVAASVRTGLEEYR